MKISQIRKFYNKHGNVQVACGYTNAGLCSVYLTNSGSVTREEFGFVEDSDGTETLELNTRSFSSVKRLQNFLMKNY